MLCSLTFIQWSAFSTGREFTHIAKILSNGMIFFPFSSGHGTADWDWQSLTQQWVAIQGCIPVGSLAVMHKCSTQWKDWPLVYHVLPSSIPSTSRRMERSTSMAFKQSSVYFFFFFFFPIRARIHTVGKQVILLERTEWVCTSKARLSRQCGMTNAVLWSCCNGRLKLVFIPGGFTPTCKTGCKGTVSGIRFS